jgi:hypothetical protein
MQKKATQLNKTTYYFNIIITILCKIETKSSITSSIRNCNNKDLRWTYKMI